MPHIYHSALLLSPQTSTVHKLYQLYATPLVRLVQGVPIVWEPFAASRSHSDFIGAVAWSPCNKFIAVAWTNSNTTGVFDAITLKQLNTFKSPRDNFCHLWLGFSPDSHFLAEVDRTNIISWDLQTGGGVGAFDTGLWLTSNLKSSAVYSTDGKMIAVVFWEWNEPFPSVRIYVYNILSQEHICSHRLQGRVVSIWTQGEYLQVATVKPGSVTVWEVGFSSDHIPAEIKSYTIPNKTESAGKILFLPALTRLAFTLKKEVLIWDAQGSKILLNIVGKGVEIISFSPDGHFFACVTSGLELCIWKDTPTGYALYQTVMWDTNTPYFSPDGESILIYNHERIQLLSTRDPNHFPSDIQTKSVDWTHFIMGFSPDQTLAAVAKRKNNTIIIYDLKSSNPQLIINAGTEVYGLRMTGDTIIIVGKGKVITWNLPVGDCVTTVYANTNDSVQTTMFDYSEYYGTILISPDLKHIAILSNFTLNIYNISTGEHLTSIQTELGSTPHFSPDAQEIWCVGKSSMSGWKIIGDSGSGVVELEPLEPTASPSGVFSWQSSQGYKITDDGWVLSSTNKPLLWLPHHWRSHEKHRIWGGQFLGLLHGVLQQVIILEFPK